MCGIYCHISTTGHTELDAKDATTLARRGPDAVQTHCATVSIPGRDLYLTFSSSVLSLRGEQVQSQPVVCDVHGSVLCWNGEAWSLDGHAVLGNDTKLISKQLALAVEDGIMSGSYLLQLLNRIKGPYAFVFYDANASKVYFGRDVLGRRSLVVYPGRSDGKELTISSVSMSSKMVETHEVDTSYIHMIDLKQPELLDTPIPGSRPCARINSALPDMQALLDDQPSSTAVESLIEQLTSAIRTRTEGVPTYTAGSNTETPSRVAVLFSGGIDCTLLARISHETLPIDQPVDLLNVAFENPRVVNARAAERATSGQVVDADPYESCPDRITGRSSFTELANICPNRVWRFVAINVPYQEYLEHVSVIVHLMSPHNTEMDLSITAALYFASRGQGQLTDTTQRIARSESYATTARVLLSGLGADELFGGYARHAAAFSRGSYQALNSELDLDFARIGDRNLGRDDRVIAHWGREARYPFLDESFVEFALDLPAWEKCGFRSGKKVPKHLEASIVPEKMEDLHPEKMVLRCAMWQLGMKGAAAEKKRAIQFGARTAKMHGGRTKGTDSVTEVRTFID